MKKAFEVLLTSIICLVALPFILFVCFLVSIIQAFEWVYEMIIGLFGD